MAVVLSSNFVASGAQYVTDNSPRICYQDFVAGANATADEEASGQPVTLLQHYLTAPGERWNGTSTSVQHVEFDFGQLRDIDYVGIAAHNLGTIGASIQLQDSTDGVSWSDVESAIVPADDESIIFLIAEISTRWLRLKITPGTDAPAIGVVYAGKSLGIQHRIYGGHTPVTLAPRWNRIGQSSDTGQFLGSVVTRKWYEVQAEFDNLKADWVRSYLKPFINSDAANRPFFWAWRPVDYPNEVGFARLTNQPEPSNSGKKDFMDVTFSMRVFVG